MKNLILISLLFTSCIQKEIITKTECDMVKANARYEACMAIYKNITDSTVIKYYMQDCRKEAIKHSMYLQEYLLYKKKDSVIRTVKLPKTY